MSAFQHIGVLGAGAWGSALANIAARTGRRVTLWAREPAFLKEIVYTMRFDEASAKYAQFGPFYVSYILPPSDAVQHLQL